MTIKIDLGALFDAHQALARIAQLDLSAKAAYHVMKLMKLTADDAKYFLEEREKLFRRHGAEKPQTQAEVAAGAPPLIEVRLGNETFTAEFTALGKVQVEVSCAPLTIEELGDVKIKAADLLALDELFGEKEMVQ